MIYSSSLIRKAYFKKLRTYDMSTAIQMIFEDITGGDVCVPESALGASTEDTESEKEAAAQASLAARAAARAAAIAAFAGPDSEDSRGCEKE